MPDSAETSPNALFAAMLTHSDYTSAAVGAARTGSGQDRTVRSGRAAVEGQSAADPAVHPDQ